MIKKPTVLILGAGASAHLGYPIGSGLLDDVTELANDRKRLSEILPDRFSLDEALAFLRQLSRSGFRSVDAFLETFETYIPLGKYLMAYVLKSREVEERLFPPKDAGWYRLLFDAMAEGATADTFAENQISIITFNYDRSLECFLYNSIKYRWGLTDKDAEAIFKRITLLHLHGIMGHYLDVPYSPQATIEETYRLSQNLKVIHEFQLGDQIEEFSAARAFLMQAKRIYFLGFGFALRNVSRFQFFNPENLEGKLIDATETNIQKRDRESLQVQLAPHGLFLWRRSPYNCREFFTERIQLD